MSSAAQTTEENHQLLLNVSSKVDNLGASLEKLASHSAAEFEKIWKHTEERDARQSTALQHTADRLSNAIAIVSDRQSNAGKPNLPVLLSAAGLLITLGVIGVSIAIAFIAPIRADIEREHKIAESLAADVRLRDERIAIIKSTQDEVKTKVGINTSIIQDIADQGSRVTRDRLSIIETDLKWMRGEKKIAP